MALKQCMALLILITITASFSPYEARTLITTTSHNDGGKTHHHHPHKSLSKKLDSSSSPALAPETSSSHNIIMPAVVNSPSESPAASPNTFSQSNVPETPGSGSGDAFPFPMFSPFPGLPSFQVPSLPFPSTGAMPSLPGLGDGIPFSFAPPTTGGGFSLGGNPFSPPAVATGVDPGTPVFPGIGNTPIARP